MKKNIYKLFLFALLPLILFSCSSIGESGQSDITTIVILHTNDTHGHPLAFDYSPGSDVAGIPARATLIKNIRSEYQYVLVLDAGDINTGRPESNFFKAEPDIIGCNYIGYDAMVLGNHEFDNPLSVLNDQINKAKYTFISANVMKADNYLVKPYIIKEYNGIKVAIFGITTKESETSSNPANISDLVFVDEVKAAAQMVEKLKPISDIIIAVTHAGIFENDTVGSKRIAKNVSGIDLIIDGHSHTYIESPVFVNNIPIVQSWMWGLVLGKGVMQIKNKKVVDFQWEAIPVNLRGEFTLPDGSKKQFNGDVIENDKTVLDMLTPYANETEKKFSQVIGNAAATYFNTDSRIKETPIGDFVADAMLWYAKTKNIQADFAVQNGGGIREDLPKGGITKKTMYSIIPFDNSVVVLSLTGSEVSALFDYIATIKQKNGAFPQVSEGVSFTLNYDKGICEQILINGKEIDPAKTYKIATNSYLASGGNGYKVFLKAGESYDTSKAQWEVLADYVIELGGNITPAENLRIKIIGSNLAIIPF